MEPQDGLVSEDVWSLLSDDQGGAWVGTLKGLLRLGPGGHLLPGPKELEKLHVQCMARQGDHLWLGTDKGLAELDPKGHFLALHDPREVIGYSAVALPAAPAEDLLVGTSLGLFSFKNGIFSRAFPGNPSDKLQVLAIHVDGTHCLGWGHPGPPGAGTQ